MSDGTHLEPVSTPVGRRAVLLAAGGWLLLAVGLALLQLRGIPSFLHNANAWLETRLAGLHTDVPIPPAVWLPALLVLIAGMALIAWSKGGVEVLPGMPAFAVSVPPAPAAGSRRHAWPWIFPALGGGLVWCGVVRAAATASTSRAVLPLWAAAIALLAVCWWRLDRPRGVLHPPRADRQTWLLLPALAAALAVTLYRLTELPNSFWGDEGAHFWLARALSQGLRRNPFDWGVYEAHPVTLALYHSIWMRLFGPSLWSWRFGSVLSGVLAVVPLYFLARKTLGARVAWSAAALMVGMPFFLAYARLGLYAIQPIAPFAMGIWLVVESVQRQSRLLAFLAGVACGIASLTYGPGHIALVVAGLLYLLGIARRPARRPVWGFILALTVGWLAAAGPFVVGTGLLGGKSLGSKTAEAFIGDAFYERSVFPQAEVADHTFRRVGPDRDIFFDPRLYALLIGRGLVRESLNLVTDGIARWHYLVGPMGGPGVIFLLAGLAWLLGQGRKWHLVLWTVWCGVCILLGSALNSFPPRTAHTPIAYPAMAAAAATGVWLACGLLRRLLPQMRPRWVDAIGVGLTVVPALLGLRAYFLEMPKRYMPSLDNVIVWRAMELGRGAHIVFVVDAPYEPGFRTWGLKDFNLGFDLGVEYHMLGPEEIQSTDFRALCGKVCRVFFVPQDADALLPRLRTQLGNGTVRTHLNADGQVIGLEFVPPP